MSRQRLQKVLAAAGLGSRRKCEELILAAAVKVNGRIVDSLPVFVDLERDIVTVHGRKIRAAPKLYFLLNKPKGVICTNFDERGRKRAIDFVKASERIFCVGRLDGDSTGAIILTNDSDLAHRLTHPRYQIRKTYVVRIKGRINGESIGRLKKGIWLAEGKTARASVKVLKRSYKESLLEVIISQGLNRQIRRMLAKVGHKVISLKRTQIGKLSIRGLGVGKSRPLSKAEISYLKRTTSA